MPTSNVALHIARPCPVNWASMTGDEQVRYCSLCRKSVYNLSEMSLEKVQDLVEQREEQVCVRFYQRSDGTVMTADCGFGLGLAAVKRLRSARRVVVAAFGALGLGGWLVQSDWFRMVFAPPMMGALANTATIDPRR